MKNGTQSSGLKLVDNGGAPTGSEFDELHWEDRRLPAADGEDKTSPNMALVFVVLTIACAVAAVAAGSYAVYLTKQRQARAVLTDVQDIVKNCQDRMNQMETDLGSRPNRPPHVA